MTRETDAWDNYKHRTLTPEELAAIVAPRDEPSGDVAGYVMIAVAITLAGFVGYILWGL